MKEEKEQQLRIEYKQQVQKSMDLPKGSFENWFIDCMKKLEIEAHNNALKMVEDGLPEEEYGDHKNHLK